MLCGKLDGPSYPAHRCCMHAQCCSCVTLPSRRECCRCRNRRVRDAHGLLATREAAYNKAREHAALGKDRLPGLHAQAEEAARKARMSALAAQEHAGGESSLSRMSGSP